MVYMVLHRYYTGFARVRMARLPQDDGEMGELRVSYLGWLQHRIYWPTNYATNYTSISFKEIDLVRTRVYGCDVRIITIDDYEHWFRFPTDCDAMIFHRVLAYAIDSIEYDDDDEYVDDVWEEGPWTQDEMPHNVDNEVCGCTCDRYPRYTQILENIQIQDRRQRPAR